MGEDVGEVVGLWLSRFDTISFGLLDGAVEGIPVGVFVVVRSCVGIPVVGRVVGRRDVGRRDVGRFVAGRRVVGSRVVGRRVVGRRVGELGLRLGREDTSL